MLISTTYCCSNFIHFQEIQAFIDRLKLTEAGKQHKTINIDEEEKHGHHIFENENSTLIILNECIRTVKVETLTKTDTTAKNGFHLVLLDLTEVRDNALGYTIMTVERIFIISTHSFNKVLSSVTLWYRV